MFTYWDYTEYSLWRLIQISIIIIKFVWSVTRELPTYIYYVLPVVSYNVSAIVIIEKAASTHSRVVGTIRILSDIQSVWKPPPPYNLYNQHITDYTINFIIIHFFLPNIPIINQWWPGQVDELSIELTGRYLTD